MHFRATPLEPEGRWVGKTEARTASEPEETLPGPGARGGRDSFGPAGAPRVAPSRGKLESLCSAKWGVSFRSCGSQQRAPQPLLPLAAVLHPRACRQDARDLQPPEPGKMRTTGRWFTAPTNYLLLPGVSGSKFEVPASFFPGSASSAGWTQPLGRSALELLREGAVPGLICSAPAPPCGRVGSAPPQSAGWRNPQTPVYVCVFKVNAWQSG